MTNLVLTAHILLLLESSDKWLYVIKHNEICFNLLIEVFRVLLFDKKNQYLGQRLII